MSETTSSDQAQTTGPDAPESPADATPPPGDVASGPPTTPQVPDDLVVVAVRPEDEPDFQDLDCGQNEARDGDVDTDGDDTDGDDVEYQRLLEDFQRLHAEREDYLDQLLRTRADFENYRKRMLRQQADSVERAGEDLVTRLLEVLDVFDAALTHGQGFEKAHGRLVEALAKEGLERIDPSGLVFDPNEADAVVHEPGEGGPVVSEVLRPGYRWKGRVVRPAMVKVRG